VLVCDGPIPSSLFSTKYMRIYSVLFYSEFEQVRQPNPWNLKTSTNIVWVYVMKVIWAH
jgi:hypothetical protein